MRNKKSVLFVALSLAVAAAALSGCASSGDPVEKVTQLSTNDYKLYLYEPWKTTYSRFRDRQLEQAKVVCTKKGLGMMPIDARTDPKDTGYEGEIVFRCVGRLEGPNLGLF